MTKSSIQEDILKENAYDSQSESNTKIYGLTKPSILKEYGISEAYSEGYVEKHATIPSLIEERRVDQKITTTEIREINRAITKKISEKQKNELIKERNYLVRKKTKKELTKKENRRLIYVRWQLDRIDDAQFGEALDIYENITEQYENFADNLKKLLDKL